MKLDLEDKNLKGALLGLVIALVEILREVLEHQALRRMEAKSINDGEVERLGTALYRLGQAVEELKEEQGVADSVQSVRKQLDSIVNGSIWR